MEVVSSVNLGVPAFSFKPLEGESRLKPQAIPLCRQDERSCEILDSGYKTGYTKGSKVSLERAEVDLRLIDD